MGPDPDGQLFRQRAPEQLALLRQAQEKQPGDLEAILSAFIEPPLALTIDRHGGSAFVRVLASPKVTAEKKEELRQLKAPLNPFALEVAIQKKLRAIHQVRRALE